MVGMQMTVYNSIIICVPTARQYKPYFSSETQYMATILKFPLHLNISIFIIIILATLPTSNGSDNTYEDCTSLISCGMLQNVGYPFWGLGRPRYCGHPELQLHCPLNESNVYPFLKLRKHGVRYHVLSIHNNSTSLKMTIQVQELSDTNNSCPFHQPNTIFEEIFQSSENVEHMNLFYNCSNKSLLDVYHGQITCSQEQTIITAYYLPNATEDSNQFKFCKFIKQVPVLTKELNHFKQGSGNLSDVLKMGYEVDYLYASACFTCQDFGGICGSSSDKKFACFRMHHKSGQWKLIAGLAIPGAFLLIALIIGLCCCKKPKFNSTMLQPKRLHSVPLNSDVETGISFYGTPVFSYNELREATNNFDVTQELGHGGYGIVYHGRLRNGTEVAVKRFHERNYKQIEQLRNEIEIFTRLHHTNLVKLYGCTTDHSQELLLVYGLIPNGTVADHLYGDRKGFGTLSWDKRMKIAIETASVLSYLHASDIIHHDVKTNNILLDNDFSVKVADLGLSRLFPSDTIHVSTNPQGTPGYIDPDYNKSYQVTNKSDVYSFGVVLVELISSLPALDINRQNDEINLSDYAMKRIQHGTLGELVDQKLGFKTNLKVKKMITSVAELAFRCLQQDKELRPSMDEVLDVLKQIESMDSKPLKGEDMTHSRETSKPIFTPRKKANLSRFPPSPNSVIESWASRSCESNISA